MIYKFKSKAAGDVVMLGPNGDELLRLLGRTPAEKGIIEVADMPEALRRLQAAIEQQGAPAADDAVADGDDGGAAPAVGLKQRLWPMVDMLKRAHAAGHPVVWGV